MTRSKYGRSALICALAFWLLEIAMYLSAFADPRGGEGFLPWEAPVTLALLALFFLSGLAHFWCKKSVLGVSAWVGSASVLLCLALAPVAPLPPRDYRIEVYKSRRSLELYHLGRKLKSYHIALGNSQGDKVVMGDGKTPLGRFRVVDKAPSRFHKWLGLNYPNLEDAWRGRSNAQLTWAEFWYLRVENLNGRIPYGTSPLGGAIGIHGGGARNDWTLGCIALANSDIDEFYHTVPLGTEVLIFP